MFCLLLFTSLDITIVQLGTKFLSTLHMLLTTAVWGLTVIQTAVNIDVETHQKQQNNRNVCNNMHPLQTFVAYSRVGIRAAKMY